MNERATSNDLSTPSFLNLLPEDCERFWDERKMLTTQPALSPDSPLVRERVLLSGDLLFAEKTTYYLLLPTATATATATTTHCHYYCLLTRLPDPDPRFIRAIIFSALAVGIPLPIFAAYPKPVS